MLKAKKTQEIIQNSRLNVANQSVLCQFDILCIQLRNFILEIRSWPKTKPIDIIHGITQPKVNDNTRAAVIFTYR